MARMNIILLINNVYFYLYCYSMSGTGQSVRFRTLPDTVSMGKQMDDVTNRQDL